MYTTDPTAATAIIENPPVSGDSKPPMATVNRYLGQYLRDETVVEHLSVEEREADNAARRWLYRLLTQGESVVFTLEHGANDRPHYVEIHRGRMVAAGAS